MGYTHYYYLPEQLDHEKFSHLVQDVKKILDHIDVQLGDGIGENEPIITEEDIVFNGVGEDGHETFALSRNNPIMGDDTFAFNFCKTALKPYDLAVAATLLRLKHHFGDQVKVSSDGGDEEWRPAKELCDELFSRLTEEEKDTYIDWFCQECFGQADELSWLLDYIEHPDAIESIRNVIENK